MKSLVSGLSSAVRRYPWVVVIATVIVSIFLGFLSGKFQPETDSNASFAPDAPELNAAESIGDLFGGEPTVAVMQVIVSVDGGNIFSLDGLQTVDAVSATVASGPFGDILVDQGGGPIVSFLAPVQGAIAEGAPIPGSDEELRSLFQGSLAELPEEQAGFVAGLLPANGDLAAPASDQGLMLIFTSGAESTEEIEVFVDASAAVAEEINAIELPDGFTAEAFSFELLFADQDEFQDEISRLFGTALLIIIVVLALVFLIKPRRSGARYALVGGIAAVTVSIVLVVLPTLATILDSVFPDFLKDWNSNIFFAATGLLLFAMFLVWTFSDRRLRRTAADTLLTIITIIFAISWMNGFGYLIYVDASGFTQILPILLIGLGVDYGIHVTSRYREEVAAGASVDDSISRAIRTVGVALVLATVSTSIGFLTNVFNDIPGLREFGVLAAIGIFASFILMLTFVPAVREILDRRGVRRGTFESDRLGGGSSGRLDGSSGALRKSLRRPRSGQRLSPSSSGCSGLGGPPISRPSSASSTSFRRHRPSERRSRRC